MMYLHEVHRMVGTDEKAFEDAYREGWMPALGTDDGTRLLWFCHHAHGSGASYQAVTVTAVADGAAWERLARRVQSGDLRGWAREVDEHRYDTIARVLVPLDFSPLDVDLAAVPTDGRLHDPALYMEDTMRPKRGRIDDYLDAVSGIYARLIGSESSHSGIRLAAAFRTAPGGGRNPEVTLMQQVPDMDLLVRLLTEDLPEEMTRPGTWMNDALEYRDEWTSRLLRSATWSPLA